jgi:hypothetical protein
LEMSARESSDFEEGSPVKPKNEAKP